MAAFEFHHKNPLEKDFQIGPAANKSWKVLEKELNKCELICSNCHKIEHSFEKDKAFLTKIKIIKVNH